MRRRSEEEDLQVHKQKEDEQGGVMLKDMTQMIFPSSSEQQRIGTRHHTSSVADRFMEFLRRKEDRMLQIEAAWAMANIGYDDYQMTVEVKADAVPIFVEIFRSGFADVQKQAMSALWEIAFMIDEELDCRSSPLLTKQDCMTVMRKVVWTLSKLCNSLGTLPDMNRCRKLLSRLPYENDTEILDNTCRVLCYMTDLFIEIQSVIDLGVCDRLVQLLRHSDDKVASSALQTVRNISRGNEDQKQVILDCSVLQSLSYLFCNRDFPSMAKEICWTISNITAGNQAQIQMVIDEGLFPRVISVLDCDLKEWRSSAVLAITNVTSRGSAAQIRYLVNQGCIKCLCKFLIEWEEWTVNTGLKGLTNILRQGNMETKRGGINPYCHLVAEANGVHYLQLLGKCVNRGISRKALELINDYFSLPPPLKNHKQVKDALPDLKRTTLHDLKPGDWVVVKEFRRKTCRAKWWLGIFQFTLENNNTDEMRRSREEEDLQVHKQKVDEQEQLKLLIIAQGDFLKPSGGVMLKDMTQRIFPSSSEQQRIGTRHHTSSVAERFMEFLRRNEDRMLQIEAAWAMANISYDDYQMTVEVKADAVPIFVEIFRSGFADVQKQAMSALWEIAFMIDDELDCRSSTLLTKQDCMTVMRKVVWAHSKLCNCWGTRIDMNRCRKLLSRLLYEKDTDILANTCLVLCYMTDLSKDIQSVIDLGVCGRLVQLLRHSDDKVASSALQTVRNISRGNEDQKQVILDCSVLQSLSYLFCNRDFPSMSDEICWTISNITAGNQAQIQMVIDEGLFPHVISVLDLKESRSKKVLAITRVTSRASAEQISYLVSLGCIKILCKFLSLWRKWILNDVLRGLANILRQGEMKTKRGRINPYCDLVAEANGVHYLQVLGSCINPEISKKALELINDYFRPFSAKKIKFFK